MTFRQLIQKYGCSPKAYHGVFYLSGSVKNLDDYLARKEENIDFCPDSFHSWYHSGLPVERIAKEVHFCRLPLHLLDNVFCPRHETEQLVEEINGFSNLEGNYIDICSGTGAIGIAVLKNHPHLRGTLLDISPDALENMRLNAERHGVEAQIIRDDWLNHLRKNPDYQIITANFPYVSRSDATDDLTDPETALFADREGWEHYGKLIDFLVHNSRWKIVVLECSAHHLPMWQRVKNLNIRLVADINGHLRVAVITAKP